MDRVWHVIAIGLAFGMTVFVHEAGHFIAARLSGMAVHEFSIGFGRPLLFWLRRGETQYSFRLWPFFSYVRIAGMDPGDEHPRGFGTKSRLAQAFVLVLGCIMNFLLAVAIFIFIGAVLGQPVGVTNTVDRVLAGGPAEAAGMEVGDKILGFGERVGLEHKDIQEFIQQHPDQAIVLEIERAGRRMSVTVTPKEVTVRELQPVGKATKNAELQKSKLVYRKIGRIGIVFRARVERIGVWRSVREGFGQTYAMVRLLIVYLYAVIAGKMPLLLEGPVGVAHTLYEEVQTGWISFLGTSAALTVGIGFLNLMPIPPLDGSRLVIIGVEAIRRRPIDKRKENLVHLVGFGLLLALVVVLTYNDILRLIFGRE